MRYRIRSIKPDMRQDERYSRLSIPARELFNGLITMGDDEGRFRARTSTVLGHVFPDDQDAPTSIRAWVSEIRDSGMVLFYIADSTPYGAFRHWAKHQKINRPTPSELPAPPSHRVVKENGLVRADKGWKQALRLTEESVRAHGDDSEASSLTRRRAFQSNPAVVVALLNNGTEVTQARRIELLSELLAAHIVSNDLKATADPFGVRWLTDMRLLLAERKGDWQEVARIIDWCQADGFWRSNVLSPAKLRKQFTALVLKAQTNVVQLSDRDREKRERTERRLASLDRLSNQGDAA